MAARSEDGLLAGTRPQSAGMNPVTIAATVAALTYGEPVCPAAPSFNERRPFRSKNPLVQTDTPAGAPIAWRQSAYSPDAMPGNTVPSPPPISFRRPAETKQLPFQRSTA